MMKEKGRFFFVKERGHEGLIREVSSVCVVVECRGCIVLHSGSSVGGT